MLVAIKLNSFHWLFILPAYFVALDFATFRKFLHWFTVTTTLIFLFFRYHAASVLDSSLNVDGLLNWVIYKVINSLDMLANAILGQNVLLLWIFAGFNIHQSIKVAMTGISSSMEVLSGLALVESSSGGRIRANMSGRHMRWMVTTELQGNLLRRSNRQVLSNEFFIPRSLIANLVATGSTRHYFHAILHVSFRFLLE